MKELFYEISAFEIALIGALITLFLYFVYHVVKTKKIVKKLIKNQRKKIKKNQIFKTFSKIKRTKILISATNSRICFKVKKKQSVLDILHKNNIYIKNIKNKKFKKVNNINETVRIRKIKENVKENLEFLTLASFYIGEIDIKVNDINNKSKLLKNISDKQSNTIYAVKNNIDLIYSNLEENGLESKKLSFLAKDAVNRVINKKDSIINSIDEFGKMEGILSETIKHSHKLEEKSSEAQNLLNSIDNISKQANLLSVNASIEAARAGEFGKGFSIVSTEIRKISERISVISTDIIDLVESIRKISLGNSESIKLSLDRINKQSEVYKTVVEGLVEIEDTIIEFSEKNTAVSLQIMKQIENFDEINQDFASMMPDMTKSVVSIKDINKTIENSASKIGKIGLRISDMEKNLIDLLEGLSKKSGEKRDYLLVCATPYPPYIICEENKKVSGIDIDILKEAARRSDISIKFDMYTWDASLYMIEKGLIDIIPSISATEDRLKFIDFSIEYRESIDHIFISKSNKNIKKYEDLYKYRIGTVSNFIYPKKFEEDTRLKKIVSQHLSFSIESLLKDEVDVIILNEYSAKYYLNNKDLNISFKVHEFRLTDDTTDKIGFSKVSCNHEEIKKINLALEEMKNDGTLKDISDRYLKSDTQKIF